MGARGPQPKPTVLKLVAGNPGKRTLNDREPIPPAGGIAPPEWLSPAGRAIWDQAAPIAIAMRTLTTADTLPFARYCEAFARYLVVKEFIAKAGTTYTKLDEAGKIVFVGEIPQASEYRKLHEILARLEDRFGMSPAARTRINVEATGTTQAQGGGSLEERRRAFFTRPAGA